MTVQEAVRRWANRTATSWARRPQPPSLAACAFWQGPSLGFDLGGDGGRTMMLVYNLPAAEALFADGLHTRFVGLNGSAYVVGGFGFSAAVYGGVGVGSIRPGGGARLGGDVG